MDIHRCRFVPFPPAAINALAFSHPSSLNQPSKGPPTLRLAIGRANGDIELWNPLKGAWHQETIFQGGKDRSIEGLVWTQDPEEPDGNGYKTPGRLRLFSVGYSSMVTEWDLATAKPARHTSGNFGELWCIAAQPRWQPRKESISQDHDIYPREGEDTTQSIAVGCSDGSIVLMSTADGDLQFQKTLTRPRKKKARVLSITFQNWNTVVAGHADSTIRIFDVRNGQLLRTMTLGGGLPGGPKEVLVWSVKCTLDGTIVSGDSTGTVSFWDGKIYSRLQRISSHKADILSIVASVNGQTVVSGGMDRRTVVYRITRGSKPGEKNRWVEVAHQRLHTHDVKAMAAFETRKLSVFASGGLDATPIIVPLREFGTEYHRVLSSLPQEPPVRSAPLQRLIMSWWGREISLWKILGSYTDTMRADFDESSHYGAKKLVAKIALQNEESITCADISSNGRMLAVSTTSESRVFSLKERSDSTLKIQKLDVPISLTQQGARILQFSPDSKWLLAVASSGRIQVFRTREPAAPRDQISFLTEPANLRRLRRKVPEPNHLHGTLGSYHRSIARVAFSADSRIIVVADLCGFLDSWVLSGFEDLAQQDPALSSDSSSNDSSSDESEHESEHGESRRPLTLGQRWLRNPAALLLPSLPSAPLLLSFRPSLPSSKVLTNGVTPPHPTRHNLHPYIESIPDGEDRLFVLTVQHQVYEFRVLAGKISDWSRRNPTSAFPKDFRQNRDRGMGCVWDVSVSAGSERIWLYGSGWIFMFDLSQDFPKDAGSEILEVNDVESGEDEQKAHFRKRRREKSAKAKHFQEAKLTDTGAGDRVRHDELNLGLGSKMRKFAGSQGNNAISISLDREQSPYTDENGDDDLKMKALLQRRRAMSPDDGDGMNGDLEENGENGVIESKQKSRPPWWCTYKYRPILGIVPIGSSDEDILEHPDGAQINGSAPQRVEVALIERPMFEVDLPPRYHGDQEWREMKDRT